MKEFNNRKQADKFAEYITGEELRRYVARKVKEYVGDSPIIFDGAVGSGQLEQFTNPKYIYAVEIQEKACEIFKENYPNSTISNMSFFNYKENPICDCVIMNPPFSISFKDLTEEEQKNIQEEFAWKKSGVVDDIFVLKSLNYTSRFGFYILFPGVTYRKTEKKFREEIGSKLVELNWIKNAFDDTSIDVVFMVVDKEKTNSTTKKEIYDCKLKKQIYTENTEEVEERWQSISVPVEREVIDPVETEIERRNVFKEYVKGALEYGKFIDDLNKSFGIKVADFKEHAKEVFEIVKEYV